MTNTLSGPEPSSGFNSQRTIEALAPVLSPAPVAVLIACVMAKKPNREEQQRMCTGKRRYASEADALDAALLIGVERTRKAYRCPLCLRWHLTTIRSGR